MITKSKRKQSKKKRKRCLGYVRKSPRAERDKENTSIEKQREEINKYCENNNIELVEIYEDDLKSGTSFNGREGFKAMYNKALKKDEEIDYFMIFKQDRLSRNTLDTLYVMQRLNALDKHLISIADHITTEDPKNKLIIQILAIFAELERD
ncbi:recombinase family protein [Sutcliffiella horikoshii]|uniref:recombinase family protein n=1 Tax=Sutcliffiella horikoshii TaxID=79883 RepID=UPI003CEB6158